MTVDGDIGGFRPRDEMFGISAALITPFHEDHSLDFDRMAAHANDVLDRGCASVTLFGTTGEGASLSISERLKAQYALTGAGISPERIVVGVNGAAVDAVTEQALGALDAGIRTLLMPPPYYFKGVSEEGLFSWYCTAIDNIANRSPRVILYHIPQVTAAPLPLSLVRRLKQRFGDLILGVKDSGGDWPTTEGFLGERGMQILVGDERHLARAVRLAAAGAISGMANLLPARLAEVVATGRDDAALNELVAAVVQLPVTPAVKALVGIARKEEGWERVRAPLQAISGPDIDRLKALWQGMEQKRAA